MNRRRFHLYGIRTRFSTQFFLFGNSGSDAVSAEKLRRFSTGSDQFL
jgi:hypothetical protein